VAGQSLLVATAEQKAAPQALSRSDVRGEADRARAILLTLQGWTSPQLAQLIEAATTAADAAGMPILPKFARDAVLTARRVMRQARGVPLLASCKAVAVRLAEPTGPDDPPVEEA